MLVVKEEQQTVDLDAQQRRHMELAEDFSPLDRLDRMETSRAGGASKRIPLRRPDPLFEEDDPHV